MGALALAALVLAMIESTPLLSLPRLIDWRTLGALAGLLILTKALELSEGLHVLSFYLVRYAVTDERQLAFLLVIVSATFAALVTNDVSLLLIVPLTRTLANRVKLPLSRLVIFETLAVNTGASLTPIGNPQNLFLWQSTKLGFFQFVGMMLPMVSVESVLLTLVIWAIFRPRPLEIRIRQSENAIDSRLFAISTILFVAFIALVNMQRLVPALVLIVFFYSLFWRHILMKVDWGLLLIIGLMFVDLRQVAHLPELRHILYQLSIKSGPNAFLAGVITSQLISNIPAAILLRHYVADLPALAYGVNVGGYGILTGSLANLIALRLAPEHGIIRRFHLASMPFLAVSTFAVLGLLIAMKSGI